MSHHHTERSYPRRKEAWGNTKDPNAVGRRIYVTHFPHHASMDDFKRFFGGSERIEGISIDQYFAFVQFKRPIDFSIAILKNGERFLGKSISIVPDLGNRSRSRRSPPPSKVIEERPRHPEKERNYFRSRSRSLSPHRMPVSREVESHRSSHDDSNGRREEKNKHHLHPPKFHASTLLNARPTLANYSSEMSDKLSEDNELNRKLGAQSDFAAAVSGPPIPVDVDYILRRMLNHNTARALSLTQIQDVINFFESERNLRQQQSAIIADQNALAAQQSTLRQHPPLADQPPTQLQLQISMRPMQPPTNLGMQLELQQPSNQTHVFHQPSYIIQHPPQPCYNQQLQSKLSTPHYANQPISISEGTLDPGESALESVLNLLRKARG